MLKIYIMKAESSGRRGKWVRTEKESRERTIWAEILYNFLSP